MAEDQECRGIRLQLGWLLLCFSGLLVGCGLMWKFEYSFPATVSVEARADTEYLRLTATTRQAAATRSSQ
jgi:hypothetical protein